MKRLPGIAGLEVTSDHGLVIGRQLDRISDFDARTLALAACIRALEPWHADMGRHPGPAKKQPAETIYDDLANVIEMFPQRRKDT